MSFTRRTFLGGLAGAAVPLAGRAEDAPLNLLLITVDDMNWDSPGCFGGRVPGITPNIDRLASQGIRFQRAHVTVSVCQPSRSALMTGRYPHRNGAEGFGPIREDVPTLQERLNAAGYLNGILAKTSHLAPRPRFCWDTYVTPEELGRGRSPELYERSSREFFEKAKAARRPFFLMANSEDPHRPFAGSAQELKNFGKHWPFDRKIEPGEAVVPGFLPDLPDVRQEAAEYLTSVYRADQTTGAVLRSLEASGLADRTLVMFLSDNGMSFPFSKTNCYLNSTRTPWIVRWPGVVKPGGVNGGEFISGIDYTPTILEAARLRQIDGVDGSSFLPLLAGNRQTGRDRVFTVFHETSARERFEMRCVETRRLGYIFNAWADGQRVFRNEAQGGLTFPAMRRSVDPAVAARVDFFLHRVPEELYDVEADPNALRNLIAAPERAREVAAMRRMLLDWMRRTGDPLAEVYGRRLAHGASL